MTVTHSDLGHANISNNAFNKPLPGQQAVPTAREAKHLATLETIDFTDYNNHKWDALRDAYARDLVVIYSGGHTSSDVDTYLAELQARFAFAPDAQVTQHLTTFASDDWTAMMSVTEGTFTEPMPTAGGEAVSPTGKPFKINTATVSRWTDGLIDQQYVLFDTAAIAQQIGIAPATPGLDFGPADRKSLFPPLGDAHLDYVIQKRLLSLDEMDFDVVDFPHLNRLHETHAQDIMVMWGDHVTYGLETHEADMRGMFSFLPNMTVRDHPVRFGAGEWTVMIGVMEGTFTGVMPNPSGGDPLPGNGKGVRLFASTFSHWKEGVMDAEYATWDNGALMQQLSIS
jgi:hypothetical protein